MTKRKKKANLDDIRIITTLKKNRVFSKTAKEKIDDNLIFQLKDIILKYKKTKNIKYVFISDIFFEDDKILNRLYLADDTIFLYIDSFDVINLLELKKMINDCNIKILTLDEKGKIKYD